MHPAHRVLAVFVLLELDAVALEPLHHREPARRGLVDGALVDDSVVGAGDLGDVVLRRRLAGDDRVVHPVHAHRERARVAHVCLLQQQHLCTAFGGGQRRHGARGAAADHQHIAVEPNRVGQVRYLHHE